VQSSISHACETCTVAWWPADEWQRMLIGEDCSMCRDGGLPTNPFSDLIAETRLSYVRLCVNQSQPGYCVVISKRHVPELHDLSSAERGGFIDDIAATGHVITELFDPVKLANLMMGFRMPHLHCHIYPQYRHDDPFALIDPQCGDIRLSATEWTHRLESIRASFASISR
jgi:diadenosine tetraphosphate (Ap4A) HIT family hydrolase